MSIFESIRPKIMISDLFAKGNGGNICSFSHYSLEWLIIYKKGKQRTTNTFPFLQTFTLLPVRKCFFCFFAITTFQII